MCHLVKWGGICVDSIYVVILETLDNTFVEIMIKIWIFMTHNQGRNELLIVATSIIADINLRYIITVGRKMFPVHMIC